MASRWLRIKILIFVLVIITRWSHIPFKSSLSTITMESLPSRQGLLQALLSYTIFGTAVVGKAISGTPSSGIVNCQTNYFPGPVNPGFEAGGLAGWTVISGDAWGKASVSSAPSYWGGLYNQVQNHFLWGYGQSGDAGVGQLRSSTFQASSVMSFLVGGGWSTELLYIGLVRERDGALLFTQTGTNDEALIRCIWDTSPYAGENVYVLVFDNSTAGEWGHINLDDIRTGCDALADKGLTFNILGQANQPDRETSTLSTAELFSLDPTRPQFHYAPYQGWFNDPSGLTEWKGQHHLFSQFNPASPLWGVMHWSHAVSPDAVHWRELPVALYPPYPEDPSDGSGRFTGSAFTDKRTGAMQLIFTDALDLGKHPGEIEQTISSAISVDGINFHYYSGNPIIVPPTVEEEGSELIGFLDPRVFYDTTDDTYKLVIGTGDLEYGKALLYVATDPVSLLSWEYVGILFEGTDSGTLWETPNFFPLGGKWVFIFGSNGDGGNHLGYYHVGTYDGKKFTSEKKGLVDSGPHTYATQWSVDSKGRNLAVTWMATWENWKWPTRVNGWAGAQSIIRELFLKEDGGLGQRAIAEVASLQNGPAQVWGKTEVTGTVAVGSTTSARLQVAADLTATNARSFTILLFASSAEQVALTYTLANSTLTLDTLKAGYGHAGVWNAEIAVPSKANNILELDILIDRSSAEIFASDGTPMTITVFPRYQESKDIKIVSHGGKTVFESVVLTPFGSSWSPFPEEEELLTPMRNISRHSES